MDRSDLLERSLGGDPVDVGDVPIEGHFIDLDVVVTGPVFAPSFPGIPRDEVGDEPTAISHYDSLRSGPGAYLRRGISSRAGATNLAPECRARVAVSGWS